MASRAWAVASLAAASLALAGCSGLPGDGPVVPGHLLGEDSARGNVQFFPAGPQAGADPREIVRGFLAAGAGFSAEHRVAREFLVHGAAWSPDPSTLVYAEDSSLQIAVESTTARVDGASAVVVVKVPLVASVDASGRYLEAPPGTVRTARYGLRRIAGAWRIAAAPDGILLDLAQFRVTFRDYPLYFADPSGAFLVPDGRWFPVTVATPTSLVRALLAGPSPFLSGAVVSGAPSGTRLAVEAVPIKDGVATVNLTARAGDAGARDRALLVRQLEATLLAVPTTQRVEVTVERVPLIVGTTIGPGGSSDDTPALRRDPRVDASLLVLDRSGRIDRLGDGRTPKAVPKITALAVAGAAHPAVAPGDGSAYAVLVGRSQVLCQVVGASSALRLASGSNLTTPSFDPRGWVWTAPGASTGIVLAGLPTSPKVVKTVLAPWLAGFDVHSLRLSRDGTRVLIAAERNGHGYLLVAGVQRLEDGTPRALSEPMRMVLDLTRALDAAWADEDEVVVLGQRGALPLQPWVVEVGGELRGTAPSPTATSLAVGNGPGDLYLGTADGQVLVRAGARWIHYADGRWPAMPG